MIIGPIEYPSDKKGLHIIELLFIILMSLFYINFDIQDRYQLIAPFFALAYIVFCFICERSQRRLIASFLLVLLLFSLVNLLLTDGSSIQQYVSNRTLKRFYSKFTQYELVVFPVFMFHRVMKLATRKQVLIIIGTTLVFALLLLRNALAISYINEIVLHSMNADVLEDANVRLVGFLFVYSFTFLILTSIILLFKLKNLFLKVVVALLIVYCFYFLLRAQFALSIVTTFISLLYLLYLIPNNRFTRILYIFGAFFVFLLLPSIVQLVINSIQPGLLQDRFVEIHNSLTGKGVRGDSDMGARFDLYWKCIEAFFNSPLLGNRHLDFNGHSTFLSEFAKTGLLGGTLMTLMFVYPYKFMKRALGRNSIYFKPLMFQLVLMGLTNPIHSAPSNFIMLYFLCPLAIVFFIEHNPKRSEYESL